MAEPSLARKELEAQFLLLFPRGDPSILEDAQLGQYIQAANADIANVDVSSPQYGMSQGQYQASLEPAVPRSTGGAVIESPGSTRAAPEDWPAPDPMGNLIMPPSEPTRLMGEGTIETPGVPRTYESQPRTVPVSPTSPTFGTPLAWRGDEDNLPPWDDLTPPPYISGDDYSRGYGGGGGAAGTPTGETPLTLGIDRLGGAATPNAADWGTFPSVIDQPSDYQRPTPGAMSEVLGMPPGTLNPSLNWRGIAINSAIPAVAGTIASRLGRSALGTPAGTGATAGTQSGTGVTPTTPGAGTTPTTLADLLEQMRSGTYTGGGPAGMLTLAALLGQQSPRSWQTPGVGYGDIPGERVSYFNEAGRPYRSGQDVRSYWYVQPELSWYTGDLTGQIQKTTNLPWAAQPYVTPQAAPPPPAQSGRYGRSLPGTPQPASPGQYPYFNAQGQPWNGEPVSYWPNYADRRWYQGLQGGQINPVTRLPWL